MSNSTKQDLLEAIEILLEMAEGGIISSSEMKILDESIESLISSDDDTLNEVFHHMTAARRQYMRNYKRLHKTDLKRVKRLKDRCKNMLRMKKEAGLDISNLACGNNGKPHRVDKSRSKAAKIGARGRRRYGEY